MQPQLCSRCKKNIAVVFITRQENGQNVNEGLCLKCAKNLGLPQVDEMMRRMGITDEDLDNISNEMMGAFGGAENLEGLTDADDPDADNEDEDGKTREEVVKTEIEDNDNNNLTIPQVVNRLGMVFFLLFFNILVLIQKYRNIFCPE